MANSLSGSRGHRHREERERRSDPGAVGAFDPLDGFASLAMTVIGSF